MSFLKDIRGDVRNAIVTTMVLSIGGIAWSFIKSQRIPWLFLGAVCLLGAALIVISLLKLKKSPREHESLHAQNYKALDLRPLRPLDKRKRLDALVSEGEALFLQWMNKTGRPKAETEAWDNFVVKFAEEHFNLKQYDDFFGHWLKAGIVFTIAIALPKDDDLEAYEAARLLHTRLDALKKLRSEIT